MTIICLLTPWTEEIGNKMDELVRTKLSIKPGTPMFGTVLLDCDLIVYIHISDELLLERTKLRNIDFSNAKKMQQKIEEEINKYDAIYVCGGSTKYLVDRISELNIKPVIDKFIENGGIYIGVSAGSVCASEKYKDGLMFIENKLDVHCDNGTPNGIIFSNADIYLTNNQAIYINDKEKIIFE